MKPRNTGAIGAGAIGALACALAMGAGAHAQTGLRPVRDTNKAAEILEQVAEELQSTSALPAPATNADYYDRNFRAEALGRLLFFDKVLSGNENISCATCHHPLAGTGDGLSLPVGEGGRGLGVTRDTGGDVAPIHERVPRNAPFVFNLGAREFRVMFHDGRAEELPYGPVRFRSPAGEQLLPGLDNVLAVQAMFPVTSMTEMAGQVGENTVANEAAKNNLSGENGVWAQLTARLVGIPDYVSMFIAAFDDVELPEDITFAHAANAIAAYEAAAFRADDSPFDRYLRGDRGALTSSQRRGMNLFYGAAGCASCHSGTFQTNHGFAAVAMPQIGPGKGDDLSGFKDGLDDFGRERVTSDAADRFRFRVPSLRNVALTGPWGHDGAYNSLESVVKHMLSPVAGLYGYDTEQAVLPPRNDLDAIDFLCHQSPPRRSAIAAANELTPVALEPEQIRQLIEFLHALTDRRSLDMRNQVPQTVPSGLPVFE